jgi:hypothetical protein
MKYGHKKLTDLTLPLAITRPFAEVKAAIGDREEILLNWVLRTSGVRRRTLTSSSSFRLVSDMAGSLEMELA